MLNFWQGWYAKTPLGKKRAKAAQADDDDGGGGKGGKGGKGKKGKEEGRKEKEEINSDTLWEKLSPNICDICLVWRLQWFNSSTFQKWFEVWNLLEMTGNIYVYVCILFVNMWMHLMLSLINHIKRNKRPTGLNGHLSIRDFTLTSCQKGSYLYINSPIIE